MTAGVGLQKGQELLEGEPGAAQDGQEGARLDGPAAVHGDRAATLWVGLVPEEGVGALLTEDDEPGLLESPNHPVAGELRKTAHTVNSTSRIRTSVSGGTGSPSDLRLSKYSSTASRILAKASSTLSPWLAQPGKEGTKAEYPPSASFSKMTFSLPLMEAPCLSVAGLLGRFKTAFLVICMALPAAAAAVPVARLDGREVMSDADLADWSAAQGCYGEDAITSRKAAFMRLAEAAIAEAALAEHGGPVFDSVALSSEAARIDRETRAPDILACIKKVLGPGEERYRRVFVRPTLIESRLRTFLMTDAKVQEGPRGRVKEAIARAGKGGSLETLAAELNLSYSSATYSLEPSTGALRPEDHFAPPPDFQKDFIERHLAPLKPGELRAEPIETDYSLQAVRLLSSDGPRRRFESVVALKTSQEEWFKSMPKRKLEILDEELRAWVKGLRGNPRMTAVEIP